jgi:hypothetical protein
MGVSGQHHAPTAILPPGKGPPVPIVQEAGWAPEPVWTQRLEEKSFVSAGDRTPIARSSSPWSDTILPELHRLHRAVRKIRGANVPSCEVIRTRSDVWTRQVSGKVYQLAMLWT